MNPQDGCHWEAFPYEGEGWDVFRPFSGEPFAFFLDSVLNDKFFGRFSFIGYDPFRVYSSKSPIALRELSQAWQEFNGLVSEDEWPFVSGMVGFIAYDHALQLLGIKSSKPVLTLPDVHFGFYDTIIIIDHLKSQIVFYSSGLPLLNPNKRKIRARERVKSAIRRWQSGIQIKPCPAEFFRARNSPFSPKSKDYCGMVEKAKEYIAAGEIYQVNLAQKFDLPINGMEPSEFYKILRQTSKTSFSSYLNGNEFRILSGSPERFLKIINGRVEARPMKGTRGRGTGPKEDAELKNELSGSMKEQAELLMITDLMRNDIGRVCEYGSVEVEHLRCIEEYPTVFQATSSILGTLRKGVSPFDVLSECFPPGSVTGCPKYRAVNIIEELEDFRRGPYCGCLGYVGFDGNMDMSVIIRALIENQGSYSFYAGSGIVADSVPEHEFDELCVKAKALLKAREQLE